jgi:hypothetical protein
MTPCIHLGRDTIVCVTGSFKPGDPCPDGYLDREEWARVQYRAGLRQSECPKCGRYYFPFEKHSHPKRKAER